LERLLFLCLPQLLTHNVECLVEVFIQAAEVSIRPAASIPQVDFTLLAGSTRLADFILLEAWVSDLVPPLGPLVPQDSDQALLDLGLVLA
jgi:hypothetical protein